MCSRGVFLLFFWSLLFLAFLLLAVMLFKPNIFVFYYFSCTDLEQTN